ncbi:hypothetical protein BD324DRAFT_259372 [Kockovaella imperatae]|uniref:Uncharacterized protein n=1 Tax=Kockovaella imperatae TaxID=4999 RepID=A0A1Y1UPY3_9TREE|nr:hypothetical protein BD324DRAFT_259372 [Kockovaella imperatae]ORX40118.1 hypothetical protein BD324DRAFT_259372 [Kockovaella imperatae]
MFPNRYRERCVSTSQSWTLVPYPASGATRGCRNFGRCATLKTQDLSKMTGRSPYLDTACVYGAHTHTTSCNPEDHALKHFHHLSRAYLLTPLIYGIIWPSCWGRNPPHLRCDQIMTGVSLLPDHPTPGGDTLPPPSALGRTRTMIPHGSEELLR